MLTKFFHITAVLCLALLCQVSLAQVQAGALADTGQARIYAAYELLEAMKLPEQLDETIERMVANEVETNPGLAPYRSVMLRFYKKYIGFENTKYESAELYASAFSLQELRELAEFYHSPIGQKVVAITPTLIQESSRIGLQAVQDNIYELQEMIKDESLRIQRMQQRGE